MSVDAPPRLTRAMWRKFLLGTSIIIVLTAGTTATALLLDVQQVVEDITPTPSSKLNVRVDPAPPGAPETILVLGSDRRIRRFSEGARSDTIMLVRLDAHSAATTVMSIPRDLKVHIPRAGGQFVTDKINAAYSIGGPALAARTVRALLSAPGRPFKINHIVNVNFSGFQRAVNYIGCVYTDIDRRYFNDNRPPNGGGLPYATIDIQPGYQRLCGSDSLDYVRFRHLDTDIVRSARQQDFLRQAKEQYGVRKLFLNRHDLARIFGRYTQSDKALHSLDSILKLMDLAIFSAGHPIREVHFPAILPSNRDNEYVTADPFQVQGAVDQFLNEQASSGPRGPSVPLPVRHHRRHHRHHHRRPSPVPGLVNADTQGENQGIELGSGVGLPVYYPKLIPAVSHYLGPAPRTYPRAYSIRTPGGHTFRAYRMTLSGGAQADYIGIQGTTWMHPPILDHPSEIRRMRHRRLELYFDGSRLRLVAWRTPRAVYWISNSLLEDVPNRQMLGMAASLKRIGSRR